MEVHKLTLAPNKSVAIIIRGARRRYHVNFEFEMTDVTIMPNKFVRYLGITIDEKLSFGQHIREVHRTEKRLVEIGSFQMLADLGAARERYFAALYITSFYTAFPSGWTFSRSRNTQRACSYDAEVYAAVRCISV